MQMDRRFADYALAGGFFLICQCVLLWALGYWPQLFDAIQSLVPQAKLDASIIGPIVTGIAAALAVIAVFVIGLLLDLSASLFRSAEMRVFSRHLDRNSEWIKNLVVTYETYCGRDYEVIQQSFHAVPLKASFLAGFSLFVFWNRKYRRRWLEVTKVNWGWGFTRAYERLWSFLHSYVVVQSGTTQLTIMTDQYSLWRTARAIATALTLLMTESIFLIIWPQLVNTADASPLYVAIFVVAQILVTALGYYITLVTYSRFCFTLFSLVYITYDKQVINIPASAAVINQPAPGG